MEIPSHKNSLDSKLSKALEEAELRRNLETAIELLAFLVVEEINETVPKREVEVHGEKITVNVTTPRLAVNDSDFENIFNRELAKSKATSEIFKRILTKDLGSKISQYNRLPDRYKVDKTLMESAEGFIDWLNCNSTFSEVLNNNELPSRKKSELPTPINELFRDIDLVSLSNVLLDLDLIESQNPIASNISANEYWKIHILADLLVEKGVLSPEADMGEKGADLTKRKLARSILYWIKGTTTRINRLSNKTCKRTGDKKQYSKTSAAIYKYFRQ